MHIFFNENINDGTEDLVDSNEIFPFWAKTLTV